MNPVNYEIKNCLIFPFNYGIQHFKIAFSKEQVEWKGRLVHFLIASLEMVPLVNYIVAIADRIFNPNWLWAVINSKIALDKLPQLDQSDIDLPEHNVCISGNDIGGPNNRHIRQYKWFEILKKDLECDGIQIKCNLKIDERMTHSIMKGIDFDGNLILIISRPCNRPEYVFYSSILRKEMRGQYEGNEVSIIFKDGRLMNIYHDSLYNHYCEISRLPEASPGLISTVKS